MRHHKNYRFQLQKDRKRTTDHLSLSFSGAQIISKLQKAVFGDIRIYYHHHRNGDTGPCAVSKSRVKPIDRPSSMGPIQSTTSSIFLGLLRQEVPAQGTQGGDGARQDGVVPVLVGRHASRCGRHRASASSLHVARCRAWGRRSLLSCAGTLQE